MGGGQSSGGHPALGGCPRAMGGVVVAGVAGVAGVAVRVVVIVAVITVIIVIVVVITVITVIIIVIIVIVVVVVVVGVVAVGIVLGVSPWRRVGRGQGSSTVGVGVHVGHLPRSAGSRRECGSGGFSRGVSIGVAEREAGFWRGGSLGRYQADAGGTQGVGTPLGSRGVASDAAAIGQAGTA
jgi:hypothetical protein